MGCLESIPLEECSVSLKAGSSTWTHYSFRKPERMIFYDSGAENIGTFLVGQKISIVLDHTCKKETLAILWYSDQKREAQEHFPGIESFQNKTFSYTFSTPGKYRIRVRFFSGKEQKIDVSYAFSVVKKRIPR